ncbi:IS3 family transposase [Brachybacterium sp. ACRRE]|uniref:IS3 family transposase n=2 Tax=Dermabacteraceae TaxID=85020 RepID=A0ABY4N7T2_9MICO|nr:IS3 family transposase [Brachybacterium sp. ACRRE]UQN30614.1 IS3 family transposase [Brachybacterium kimchii]
MIRFIDVNRDQFGVEAICRVLSATDCGFLTSRGYRAAKQRPASARDIRDEMLIGEIRRVHAENYGVDGYRKVHQAMRRAGWEMGRDQTARLMKVAGLEGVRRGRKALTTTGAPDHCPDLVERDFSAQGPNLLWVADITYVRIPNGFCHTAFITDVCTRRIVGWTVAASLHTEALPLQALAHALPSTRAEASSSGLVYHSDRGRQCAPLAYSDALSTAGMKAAVGAVGDSYDCQSVSAASREDEEVLAGMF